MARAAICIFLLYNVYFTEALTVSHFSLLISHITHITHHLSVNSVDR